VNDVDHHNEEQIDYFTRRPLPRMTVDPRGETPYIGRQVDVLLTAARVAPEDRVLDVGCGLGKYTLALARRGVRVEGLDLTPRLVDSLRSDEPTLVVHLGDVMDPPEDLRDRFDVVTGFFVLHHVADLPAAFAGVRALLRSGGRAVFCEPNPLFPGYYVQLALTPGMTWEGDGGIVRMRPAKLEAAAAASGLVGFTTQRFGALPPAVVNRPWGAELERRLEAVPGWAWGRAFQLFSMRVAP
jgi:2-polyprenyl-3-methyl-5-hydroxy-6-metoxy-1,4-benzoquinol methylase